jgi:hypothetical protein
MLQPRQQEKGQRTGPHGHCADCDNTSFAGLVCWRCHQPSGTGRACAQCSAWVIWHLRAAREREALLRLWARTQPEHVTADPAL